MHEKFVIESTKESIRLAALNSNQAAIRIGSNQDSETSKVIVYDQERNAYFPKSTMYSTLTRISL